MIRTTTVSSTERRQGYIILVHVADQTPKNLRQPTRVSPPSSPRWGVFGSYRLFLFAADADDANDADATPAANPDKKKVHPRPRKGNIFSKGFYRCAMI